MGLQHVLLRRMRVALRWCGRGLFVLMLLVVALWGYAYAKQWLFRLRAQRLLADVNAMQVRHATWADAQQFRARWGRWGNHQGECDANFCQYLVMLSSDLPKYWYPDIEFPRNSRLIQILYAVGLRPITAVGGFEVRDGQVVEHSFGMSALFKRYGEIDIVAEEGPRMDDEFQDVRLHPDYSIGEHPSFVFLAMFTPDAPPEKKKNMFDFRFHCLTALRACDGEEQVLPEAYEEWKFDRAVLESDDSHDCGVPFWVAARDEQGVVVGDVVRAERETSYPRRAGEAGEVPSHVWTVWLRVTQVLKGRPPESSKGLLLLEVDDLGRWEFDGKFPYKAIIFAGNPMFGDDAKFLGSMIGTPPCDFVEASQTNMAETLRGLSADYAPSFPIYTDGPK